MAAVPLILKGNLTLGGASVAEEVTHFSLQAKADEVDIPATLGAVRSKRKGGVEWTITIGYLSADAPSTSIFRRLWAAIATADGELAFTGSMRDANPGTATNPLWSGTMVVTGAALGGEAEGLSTDSQTFKLTGPPTLDNVT